MYNLDSIDTIDYKRHQTEIVYFHKRSNGRILHEASSDASSESESEGMTNDASSCWMISVIQALRGSSVFRNEYAPEHNEMNILKKELFTLFDISEGKNHQKRRPVKPQEIREFKRLVINQGLRAKMDHGFFENPFLLFLLKKFDAKPIEYHHKSSSKTKKELVMSLPLTNTSKSRSFQAEIKEQKIAFANKSKVPKFLPVYLDRPIEKHYYSKKDVSKEASRTPVDPSSTIKIPLADKSGQARYKLTSVVIGRDSIGHAYSYVIEKDSKGKIVWVQYNDSKVTIHELPETKKKSKNSNLTPVEDASKHGVLLLYEFSGYS